MAVSNITIKGITPNLNILGDTQRFIFSDSSGYFGLRNNFVPTQTIPSLVGFDFSNNSFSGFRFVHQTPFGDNLGTFKLKSFINNDLIGTDILTINSNTIDFNQSVTFSVPPLFQDPTQDLHAANKRFVDNHTWLASSITNFDSTVRTYRLNDFLAPTSNITLNSFRLINLANPINAQDGVNKDYADNMQKTVTLTGAISANGSTGSSINSTFNLRLDQITIPTANINLNNNKIINLATPVLATDAATKSFVESSVSSGISGVPTAVTLTGDVTGSGNTGSSITTTLNKRLDQINAPISSVSLNFQKLTNLATPVLSTDAATRGFIDGKTWTASQITDFDIQVRLSRLDQMAIPTTSLNVNSQNIINLSTPTLATHAVNKSYADSLITAQLSALSILSTTGIISRTATNTFATRSITTSTGLNITNGDGILGNPTISISNIPINNLANYPSNTSLFLRGDGTWNSIPTIDINNGTTNQLSISRLSGYPFNSTLFLRGDGQWATAGGGSASFSSNSINVNTDGGSTNWLRRNINTVSGVQVYGLTSTSYILESSNGESAGIGFDGSQDACTIWTAGDSGSYLNVQDEDTSNSRAAYVATNGAWTTVSSQKRKHSIKEKNNNKVLERFLKLSVKSYGYKYEIREDHTEKQKRRIEKKLNKMATGLILEELFAVFPNCIPDYYNKLFENKRNKDLILEEEIKNPENSGIDYNTLMCYFIMAFQEYVNKTDKLILELQNKVNT